jgi:hypothetical protein
MSFRNVLTVQTKKQWLITMGIFFLFAIWGLTFPAYFGAGTPPIRFWPWGISAVIFLALGIGLSALTVLEKTVFFMFLPIAISVEMAACLLLILAPHPNLTRVLAVFALAGLIFNIVTDKVVLFWARVFLVRVWTTLCYGVLRSLSPLFAARLAPAEFLCTHPNVPVPPLERLHKYLTIQSYIWPVRRRLNQRWGKQLHFTPAQVKQANRDCGLDSSYDCYGLSMHTCEGDFEEYHSENGESCNYEQMRLEIEEEYFFSSMQFEAVETYFEFGGEGSFADSIGIVLESDGSFVDGTGIEIHSDGGDWGSSDFFGGD